MFKGEIEAFDHVIAMLYIQKKEEEVTSEHTESQYDYDHFPDVYYGSLGNVSEDNKYFCIDDYDYGNMICFPNMKKYYELCFLYGRMNKIPFKKNPYIKKSVDYMNQEMGSIYNYCLDYDIFIPKKIVKNRYPALRIIMAPEFWQPVDLISALYNIRAFFEKETVILEKLVLDEKRRREIKLVLPKVPTVKERRKAA